MLRLSFAFGSSTKESICFFMYKNLGVVSSVQSFEIEAAAIAKSWQMNTHDNILGSFGGGYECNREPSELRQLRALLLYASAVGRKMT